MKSDNSNVVIKPLRPYLGAKVSGVSIDKPLSDKCTEFIEDEMRRYKVFLFRGKSLDAHTLAEFGVNFGELRAHRQKR